MDRAWVPWLGAAARIGVSNAFSAPPCPPRPCWRRPIRWGAGAAERIEAAGLLLEVQPRQGEVVEAGLFGGSQAAAGVEFLGGVGLAGFPLRTGSRPASALSSWPSGIRGAMDSMGRPRRRLVADLGGPQIEAVAHQIHRQDLAVAIDQVGAGGAGRRQLAPVARGVREQRRVGGGDRHGQEGGGEQGHDEEDAQGGTSSVALPEARARLNARSTEPSWSTRPRQGAQPALRRRR